MPSGDTWVAATVVGESPLTIAISSSSASPEDLIRVTRSFFTCSSLLSAFPGCSSFSLSCNFVACVRGT